MNWKAFKYTSPILIYVLAVNAFFAKDIGIFLPLILVWIGIPILELLFKPDPSNMDAAEEEIAKADHTYDYLLYMIVPMQYLALYLFLNSFSQEGLEGWMIAGRIFVMGLLCGTFGINVGHELGHRTVRFEQQLAKALLLTSLYMHFYIEHNRGHHKRVSTPEDPSSARPGESVYAFYLRSIIGSFQSAWEISNRERLKKNIPWWHPRNEMLMFQFIQIGLVAAIVLFFGWMTALWFVCAAVIGFLLLETVNYIEHYGLQRKKTGTDSYERPRPAHSWNSDHVVGRLVLFELSRHSDHHYMASRKYQVLRHHEEAPQMPTGYPGMMILSLIPPLWFRVMDPRSRQLQEN
jgi:alkane 1-monooxygenase